MNKAVFFDRDGVINNDVDKYYVYQVENFIFNQRIGENIKKLQDAGYLIIIISNQGGIAKKWYTFGDVEKVHAHMQKELEKYNVKLTEIYYCPHHPDDEPCFCRKPQPLMIQKAIARFNINTEKSFFIGDRDTDYQAATLAGVKAYKIKANEDITYICDSILKINN